MMSLIFTKNHNYLKIMATIKSRLCSFFLVGGYSDLLPKFVAKCPTSVAQKKSKLRLFFQQA
jgi:hypothetical protein